MILNVIMCWGVIGAGLTVVWSIPATQTSFWISSFFQGPFLWAALLILYLLRRYGGMEYSFWRNE